MRTAAARVVDGSMLASVKKLLAAPVIEARDGGRRTRPRAGTPRGGPASPLLANIYLHLLDRNFRRHVECGALKGRLVRHADDFVIACPRPPRVERESVGGLMAKLGLTLHPDKTRVVRISDEWVDLLGYRIRRRPSGRVALDIAPKAMSRIRDALREVTRRTYLSQAELMDTLSSYIRGAGAHFRLAEPRTLWNLDRFVLARIARWSRHERGRRLPEWSLARGTLLHRAHGLATWCRRKQPA
jgi:hypothetical protein